MLAIRLGYTGAREGMSDPQKNTVIVLLRYFGGVELKDVGAINHGDCVGGDEEFDDLVASTLPEKTVDRVIHPPVDTEHQAYCERKNKDFYKQTVISVPQTHLARNRNVVTASTVLIGAPNANKNPGWGGTWYTVDYAIKNDKLTLIVRPDGNLVVYNYDGIGLTCESGPNWIRYVEKNHPTEALSD